MHILEILTALFKYLFHIHVSHSFGLICNCIQPSTCRNSIGTTLKKIRLTSVYLPSPWLKVNLYLFGFCHINHMAGHQKHVHHQQKPQIKMSKLPQLLMCPDVSILVHGGCCITSHLTTCNCSGNRQRFPGYRFGLVFGSGKRRRQPAFGTANYDRRDPLGYCWDQQAIDSVYEYQIMYYMQPFLTYCLPWHEVLFWGTPASNYQIIGLPFGWLIRLIYKFLTRRPGAPRRCLPQKGTSHSRLIDKLTLLTSTSCLAVCLAVCLTYT